MAVKRRFPDPDALLQQAGCGDRVIAHCRAVRECAEAYASCQVVDRDLVLAGASLHDVGRGSTHSIAHAQAGADLCRRMALPADITRIVERHIGAGLTADECVLAGLLPRDCMPRTIEEQIVAHADNRVMGTREISIERRLMASIHLPRKVRRRMMRLAMRIELFRT